MAAPLRGRVLGAIALAAAAACAAQATRPEFDVAMVRQSRSDEMPRSNFSLDSGNMFSSVRKDEVFAPQSGYFAASNMPLLNYIDFAYNLTGTQVLALRFKEFMGPAGNMPDWVKGERFDVQARADGHPTKDQMRLMLQTLLAERFKLVVHMDTRQVPVFAMVKAKTGKPATQIRVHPSSDTCTEPASLGDGVDLPTACGVIAHLSPSGPGRVRFGGRGVSLALLAGAFPTQTGMSVLPRPVIDGTGLTGTFDFVLEWAPDTDDGTANGPSFQDALKQQLGFRLDAGKGPVEVLVIDHVEHPSAQ